MIRNKYILCFMFLLFAATSFAQSRYALSFSDYMDGKFTALENLTIESRSKSKRFWNGGADFKPETGNKETDKLLKKDVKYIIHQDTLYVNCRQLRYQGCKFGNWYAPGFRFVPLFEGRLKYISEADSGVYEAMNKGLRMATGDVVGYLNSDDVFKDRHVIETIAQTFEQPEIDAVFGNVLYRRRNGERLLRRYSGNHFNPGMLPYGIMPPHPSFYARKSCYIKSGGFNTSFRIAGDYELFLRFFLKERICYRYLDLDVVVMRLGGISNRSFYSVLCGNSIELMKACRINGIYTNWLMLFSRFFMKVGGIIRWLIVPHYIWRK